MRLAAARMIVFGAAGSLRRLLAIAAGVALGSAMVLVLLGAYAHMPERDDRVGWATPRGLYRTYTDAGDLVLPASADDQVLVMNSADYVRGRAFERVTVATTAHSTVAFPSNLAPLRPGQYYASPALADLIARYPANELGQRYGEFAGVLPDTALRGPDQLIVLMADDWDHLVRDPNARVQTGLPTTGPHDGSLTFRIILGVGAVALLIPVALLVGIVSQLGAAARRERYATVRLIGAGRRAMALLAAVEMAAAALLGAVAGLGVAAALRPLARRLPINGATSFPGDLDLSAPLAAGALAAVVAVTTVIAWWRAYRDDDGALGATRERAEKPATWTRVILLVVGLAALTGATLMAQSPSANESLVFLGLVGGFAAITLGVVLAGSWLTRVVSAAFARRARGGSALVAASRLARHPRATFRSVAGVVVAVFIVSVLAGVSSSVKGIVASTERPGLIPLDAVVADVEPWSDPQAMVRAAQATPGVERAMVVWTASDAGNSSDAGDSGIDDGSAYGADFSDDVAVYDTVLSRDDAVALGIPDLPDSPWVSVDFYTMMAGDIFAQTPAPAAPGRAPDMTQAMYVVAMTDGTDATVDRARTALDVAGNTSAAPVTRPEFAGAGTLDTTYQMSLLAYLGMAIAVGISALTLTIATVAAALDRKRTFALLRLSGMPVRSLRRTVTIEAAMPLGVTLVASAGLGFAVALVLVTTLGHDLYLTWPDPLYWWALLAAVAVAAVAVGSSFGLVRRSTEIASTRFE